MEIKKINIVGSGIVGLLSAFYLHRAGYKVAVFDAGPDPLTDYDRNKAGATFSGGNARHVSATETSPHASPSMTGQIYLSGDKGGWMAKDPGHLSPSEKTWIDEFEALTQNPKQFNKFSETVVKVNNLGKDLWRKLIQEESDLFLETPIQDSLTVFFLDTETFKSETEVETGANPLFPPKSLNGNEIIKKYPALKNAVENKIIAGALILDGFAINAISFCQNLISYLKSKGVNFSWNQEISDLNELEKTDHYLVSTGARQQDFLKDTTSHQKIMGVAGVWIRIPNPDLKTAFKIACPYPTGYINGTLDGNHIILSGGYGFIGEDKLNIKSPGIQILLQDLKQNAQKIFPERFAKALKNNTLDERACVRPMTPNGLGVFEVMQSDKSKVIFAGANSAGGFTQAPVIADAVLDILSGKKSFLAKASSQN